MMRYANNLEMTNEIFSSLTESAYKTFPTHALKFCLTLFINVLVSSNVVKRVNKKSQADEFIVHKVKRLCRIRELNVLCTVYLFDT